MLFVKVDFILCFSTLSAAQGSLWESWQAWWGGRSGGCQLHYPEVLYDFSHTPTQTHTHTHTHTNSQKGTSITVGNLNIICLGFCVNTKQRLFILFVVLSSSPLNSSEINLNFLCVIPVWCNPFLAHYPQATYFLDTFDTRSAQ